MRGPAVGRDAGRAGGGAGDRRRAGFTLVEVVVVLVVMGLALGIVAGFLPRRNGALELAAAAGRVASTLRLARARAITQGRTVTVALADGGHALAADGVARALPAAVALTMEATPALAGAGTGAGGAGAGAIRFAPDGSASGGAIRVRGAGRARLVRVDWLTGRVSVDDAS